LARTQELILRDLPAGSLDILDVGGGPGVYAQWLVESGHRVCLVDPVALHVDQAKARHPNIEATIGDARRLDSPDATVDVVLLLGPLYHLTDRQDRIQALREARRVLRPGGRLFAAAISRFAALIDLLIRLDRLHEPDVLNRVRSAVQTGVLSGHREGLFTTAYLHRSEELVEELRAAGFADIALYNVEGPGFLIQDLAERWADPQRRDIILDTARLVETEPTMMGASSHLMATAKESNPTESGES